MSQPLRQAPTTHFPRSVSPLYTCALLSSNSKSDMLPQHHSSSLRPSLRPFLPFHTVGTRLRPLLPQPIQGGRGPVRLVHISRPGRLRAFPLAMPGGSRSPSLPLLFLPPSPPFPSFPFIPSPFFLCTPSSSSFPPPSDSRGSKASARQNSLATSNHHKQIATHPARPPSLTPPPLPQCLAKLQGWSAGVAVLDRFTGCDNRLCMMEVLAFYKGHTDLESVLDHASDDCHSAARASFACALYFEARGRGREAETMALPLLSAVASVDCGGDTYLRSLARIHMHHVRQGLMRDAPLQQNKRMNHRKVNGVLQLSSTPSSLSSSSSSSTSSSSLESLASLASSPSITVGKEGGMGERGLGVISVYTTVSPPVCRSPSKPALFRTALVKNSC